MLVQPSLTLGRWSHANKCSSLQHRTDLLNTSNSLCGVVYRYAYLYYVSGIAVDLYAYHNFLSAKWRQFHDAIVSPNIGV